MLFLKTNWMFYIPNRNCDFTTSITRTSLEKKALNGENKKIVIPFIAEAQTVLEFA